MFEFGQLRCFVAVAEELHFGRAAERLNMTQPPLSRQVQLLERAVGAMLLERNSRVVRLTPAGRRFLADARRILQLSEAAGLTARRAARGEVGTLALGCTAAASYGFVPRLVAALREEAPGIDLVLKEMITAEQMEALESGLLDAGLVRLPFAGRNVESACVLRERLLLAVPAGHPLATAAEPRLRDLHGEPMVAWSPVEARYFHDLVGGICRAEGIAPREVQHISQGHTVLALVGAGLGLALVPEAVRVLNFGGVVLRPLADLPRPVVELFLVWRAENPNPALPTFRGLALRGTPG